MTDAYAEAAARAAEIAERTITTADGKTLRTGDRAFNFYDGWWGTVTGPIDAEGWFDLVGDGAIACLNGERVAVVVPRSNPHHAAWLVGRTVTAPKAARDGVIDLVTYELRARTLPSSKAAPIARLLVQRIEESGALDAWAAEA